MEITKTVCEHCKTETADYCAEDGWIQIRDAKISVYGGRAKDSTAITLFFENSKLLDFCCTDCLAKFITKHTGIGRRKRTRAKKTK